MFTIKCFQHLTNNSDHAVCSVYETEKFSRNNINGWIEFSGSDGLMVAMVKGCKTDAADTFLDHLQIMGFDKIIVENQGGRTIDVLNSIN